MLPQIGRLVRTLMLLAPLALGSVGCSEPEKTEDPNAIEKARQEHIQTMQRERDEAGQRR